MLLRTAAKLAKLGLARAGCQSLYTATSQGGVHYFDGKGRGQLPPIVLVHGLGSNATSCFQLINLLLPYTRRVIALDLIGHGLSDLATSELDYQTVLHTANEALSSILDEPAVIFGNSLGGAVALQFAVTHPELTAGLVLTSPAGAPFSASELAEIREVFNLNSSSKAMKFLGRVFHRTPWLSRLMARELCEIYQAADIQNILGSLQPGELVDTVPFANLLKPILLMWGKSDRILPSKHLNYFRDLLPSHLIVEEPEALGHSPHIERPGVVASRMLTFIRDQCHGQGIPTPASREQT